MLALRVRWGSVAEGGGELGLTERVRKNPEGMNRIQGGKWGADSATQN